MPDRLLSPSWRDAEQTLRQTPCTCIDGRTSGDRYSVAGGSFGLVLQVLSAIQEKVDRNLDTETITKYLDVFAEKVSPLYLHTDQHALDRLIARMGLPPETQLADFSTAQQRSFRELATRPENQGCGHLKLLMLQESDYHVPRQLAERTLDAFFRRYFYGQPGYLFEVLAGEHQESAAVILENLRSNQGDSSQMALYRDDSQASSFFCHRPVKSLLIERYLSALATSELTGLSLEAGKDLVTRHNAAAERTLSQLAPGLPLERIDW